MITLCIPTIRRFDTLRTCINSALTGSVPVDKVMVIDNSAGQLRAHEFHNQPVYIHTPPFNFGCAKTWNMFMRENDDQVIIANDDVEFLPNTVEHFRDHFKDGAQFMGANGSNAFSLFCLRKSTWETVGPFDEQFWPAYYEDNDYMRRMKISGIPLTFFVGHWYHHVGSATIASYTSAEKSEHQRQFAANGQRYKDKWGGPPNAERYTAPYNQ